MSASPAHCHADSTGCSERTRRFSARGRWQRSAANSIAVVLLCASASFSPHPDYSYSTVVTAAAGAEGKPKPFRHVSEIPGIRKERSVRLRSYSTKPAGRTESPLGTSW
eukprot:3326222-Rhodomonas_salina.6